MKKSTYKKALYNQALPHIAAQFEADKDLDKFRASVLDMIEKADRAWKAVKEPVWVDSGEGSFGEMVSNPSMNWYDKVGENSVLDWIDPIKPKKGLRTVMAEEEKLKERWKPKVGEKYYWIDPDGDRHYSTWNDDKFDKKRHAFGNCFRTESEAQSAAEKVKALLLSL
jgi:hypothetical protein